MSKIKPLYDKLQKFNDKLDKFNQFGKDIEKEYDSDPDLIIISDEDNIKEEAPTCNIVQELVDYIKNAIITRNIKYIILHCTATRTDATVSAIQRFWREVRGWRNPGYHIIFTYDKGFTVLADFNSITNGVAGQNAHSIHLSYIGGIDVNNNNRAKDTRSEYQRELIKLAVLELKKQLPHVEIKGHNEFANKACPSFNVQDEPYI